MQTVSAAIAGIFLFGSALAASADLDVKIVDVRGQAAADAVVEIRGAADAPDARPAVTHVIDQRNETFIPYVEIFRPGDSVVFRNGDRTRHHVYSFASAKSFEFVTAPGESTSAIVLDHSGEIPVGCNIHDRMITHLYVSDAPWAAKSDAQGHAHFHDIPPGRYEVSAWHPQLRPGKAEPRQSIEVDANGATAMFTLSLLPDPRADDSKERLGY